MVCAHGGIVDYNTLGSDEHVAEYLNHLQHAEEIRVEELLGLFNGRIERGHAEAMASVVDQDVELASGLFKYCGGCCSDGFGQRNVKCKHSDIWV